MERFQPTKPRILWEESKVAETVMEENEITFPSNSRSNSSLMNVSDTDVSMDPIRKVSAYSFVNARFQPCSDHSSLGSDTSSSSFVFKGILSPKKGQ